MNDLLYITSSSFSGSTLLTFLLSAHPGVATVGELKATAMGDVEHYRCSCGSLIRGCPFWRRVTEELAERGVSFDPARFGTHFAFERSGRVARRLVRADVRGFPFEWARALVLRGLPSARRELRAILDRNRMLIEAVCRLKGTNVFLDGSKDPVRLKYLADAGHWNVKAVYLLRDGRGVTESIVRRQKRECPGSDGPLAVRAARRWRRTQEECLRVLEGLPRESWVRVHYEDVCRDPARALEPVLRLIGQGPTAIPEAFRKIEHHILGNYMRLNTEPVRLDQRWRTNLSSQELADFERVAGEFNRRQGYE